MGIFYVDNTTVERVKNRVTFSAYDKMIFLHFLLTCFNFHLADNVAVGKRNRIAALQPDIAAKPKAGKSSFFGIYEFHVIH